MKKQNTPCLCDAEHPIRKFSIDLLEELTDRLGKEVKNEEWFKLEDFIVNNLAVFIHEQLKGRLI